MDAKKANEVLQEVFELCEEYPGTVDIFRKELERINELLNEGRDNICVKWGEKILEKRGFSDWKIIFSPISKGSQGVALFDSKEIRISWETGFADYALMAHEIAHVCRQVSGSESHDAIYADILTDLTRKYFQPCFSIES